MEIKSVIIDKNYNPYGFEIENGEVIKLEDFIENPPKNSQIAVINKNLLEINGFKFRNIKMKQLSNNKLKEISNNLKLIKRLVVKDNLKGFEVSFCEKNLKLTLNEIYNLSKFCNCENFILKSNKKNVFICGRTIKIKDLPSEEFLRKGKQINNKSTISKNNLKNNEKKYDVIDVFDYLKSKNALIVKLPTEKYSRSKKSLKKISNEFTELGIGEITSPKIRYNESNININATFKKYGNVFVEFEGNNFSIPAYVLTTKHIFSNGMNHLNKFGVILDKETEKEFYEKFIGTFSLEKIENDLILNPLKSILNKKNIYLYSLDTSKIDFIKKDKLESFILEPQKIKDLCLELLHLKTSKRYLNAMKKETEEEINKKGLNIPKGKTGIYNSFNDEMLTYLKDTVGIDIYTGMFVKTEKNIDNIEETKDIEISYSIKGLKTIPSSKDIINKNPKALKFIDSNLENIMKDLISEKSVTDKYRKIELYIDDINEKIETVIENLWKHKLANYKKGNEKFFVKKNSFSLVKETSNYKEYQCNIKGIEDLILKISNVEIREIES